MNDRIQEIKEYVAQCERSGFRYHEAVKDVSYLLSEVERLTEGYEVLAQTPMTVHLSEIRNYAKQILKGESPYKLN